MEHVVDAFQNGRYLHDPHASIRQAQRGIDDYQIEEAIGFDAPEVIETEPHYWKGPAVLIRGVAKQRVIHIFSTINDPPLFVTCYRPSLKVWYPGFRKRRKEAHGHEVS